MNVSDIIKGPFFPEAIKVKKVDTFGEEYLLLEGIGCQTNQYYERIFTQDELHSIAVISTAEETDNYLTGNIVQNRLLHVMLNLENKHSQKRATGISKSCRCLIKSKRYTAKCFSPRMYVIY